MWEQTHLPLAPVSDSHPAAEQMCGWHCWQPLSHIFSSGHWCQFCWVGILTLCCDPQPKLCTLTGSSGQGSTCGSAKAGSGQLVCILWYGWQRMCSRLVMWVHIAGDRISSTRGILRIHCHAEPAENSSGGRDSVHVAVHSPGAHQSTGQPP